MFLRSRRFSAGGGTVYLVRENKEGGRHGQTRLSLYDPAHVEPSVFHSLGRYAQYASLTCDKTGSQSGDSVSAIVSVVGHGQPSFR